MLDIQRLVLGLNRLFDRDNVHADARTARRYHGGDMLQRQKGHPLKKCRNLGVLCDLLLVHIEKLGAAGHKHRQYILFFAAGILPVILQKSYAGHLVQQWFQFFRRPAGGLYDLGQGHRLAHFHFQRNVGHLVRYDAGKPPILGVIRRQRAVFGRDAVGDHLAELYNFFAQHGILGDLIGQLALIQRERSRFAHGLPPFPLVRFGSFMPATG